MIGILKQQGRYSPVVICNECGEVIDDAFQAMEICSNAPEGASAESFHVHKGRCDHALSKRVEGLSGPEELAVHLLELLKNTLRASDPHRVEKLLETMNEDS